ASRRDGGRRLGVAVREQPPGPARQGSGRPGRPGLGRAADRRSAPGGRGAAPGPGLTAPGTGCNGFGFGTGPNARGTGRNALGPQPREEAGAASIPSPVRGPGKTSAPSSPARPAGAVSSNSNVELRFRLRLPPI